VAGLSISGMPIFNGFISKTMTIAGAFEDHQTLIGIGLEVAAVGTFLSVGIKLPYFAFWGGKRENPIKPRPIPVNMYLAMGIAALLCTAQGLYPQMLYALLPFQEAVHEYHPWTAWHVLQTSLLLGFTGLVFYLMRKTMKPHVQRNVDFELLYILAGRAFLFLVSRPVAWADSIWTTVYRVVGLRVLLFFGWLTSAFDWRAIDGVVDGVAYTTRNVGGRTAKTQTGKLGDYLAMAIAFALVVLAFIWAVS
jgi:multicomponent Na+:H+ antiporter subunit D